jgi:anti-sigma B factor antagonist
MRDRLTGVTRRSDRSLCEDGASLQNPPSPPDHRSTSGGLVMTQHPDDLVVEVRHLGTSVEIAVSGELDIASAPALRRQIADMLRDRPEIAVVDLRGVTFIDSSGLHALLASRGHALAAGSRLVVIRPTGPADRAFELAGLDSFFPQLEPSEVPTDRDSVPSHAV